MIQKKLIQLALGSLLVVASVAGIASNKPMGNELPMSKVIELLKANGYEKVKEIELEKGMFVAEVFDSNWHRVKVIVDATSGELIKSEQKVCKHKDHNKKRMSMLEVVKAVEAAGYRHIYEVESHWKPHDKGIEVKALDQNNRIVVLRVNPYTGKMEQKHWYNFT